MSNFTAYIIILFFSSVALLSVEKSILKDIEISNTQGIIAGATTSLNAEVQKTPTNTLYEELKTREKELAERENKQKSKEEYFNSKFEPTPGTIKFLYILTGGLFILVIINFAFDIKRYYYQQT